jgi:hypothetical protein
MPVDEFPDTNREIFARNDKMIDTHLYIFPGIDDGSDTMCIVPQHYENWGIYMGTRVLRWLSCISVKLSTRRQRNKS